MLERRRWELGPLVLWSCGLLYLLSLGMDWGTSRAGSGLAALSPSLGSLFRLGMSGARAVFLYHRWWTVLSAGWLHGGLLHIAFNMMAVRDLAPLASRLYGSARTTIIYTVAGVFGFVTSSVMNWYVHVRFLGTADFTVGASAAIFGLIGALLYYGRSGGSALIARHAQFWAIGGLLCGFFFASMGIDNWAHLGGLASGYVASLVLDPLKPERDVHGVIALLCLLASLAAVAASLLTTA